MSSGDPCYDDIPPKGSLEEFLKLLMEFPALKVAIAVQRRWITEWDVPYLAGSSLDGSTVYFDPKLHSLPEWATRLIALHEIVEWSLKPYLVATSLGTTWPLRLRTATSSTWATRRRSTGNFFVRSTPRLSMRRSLTVRQTWTSAHMAGKLKRMLEDLQAGKVSKISVLYGHGARHRECDLCSMWKPPSSCSLVAGPIAADAVCDRFVREL